MRRSIRSLEDLPDSLILSDNEKGMLTADPELSFLMTRHWLSLLDGSTEDPLRLQALPRSEETLRVLGDLEDPLGEASKSPLPGLLRRYRDRVLVLVTGTCALHCRHCFRRRNAGEGSITETRVEAIAAWLSGRTEIKELILSGGDPLTLSDGRLGFVIEKFRASRPDLVLRLATRMPVVLPERITAALGRVLRRHRPLWFFVQINHPRELCTAALSALDRIQGWGIPILSQSVLLRGVNDSVEVLERLFRALVSAGVNPYYLFQGDLAGGTSHFRLPLAEARRLIAELRGRLSELAMPAFAVDLPGGGGKVLLEDHPAPRSAGDGRWILQSPGGGAAVYTDPPQRKECP